MSATADLEEALLVTGFAYDQASFPNLARFCRLLGLAQGVRRPGAAALDLAYIAAGRFDGFWESGLNPWDVQAGVLLIAEAGGKVTDYAGGADFVAQRTLVAANPGLHEKLRLEVIAAGDAPPRFAD